MKESDSFNYNNFVVKMQERRYSLNDIKTVNSYINTLNNESRHKFKDLILKDKMDSIYREFPLLPLPISSILFGRS